MNYFDIGIPDAKSPLDVARINTMDAIVTFFADSLKEGRLTNFDFFKTEDYKRILEFPSADTQKFLSVITYDLTHKFKEYELNPLMKHPYELVDDKRYLREKEIRDSVIDALFVKQLNSKHRDLNSVKMSHMRINSTPGTWDSIDFHLMLDEVGVRNPKVFDEVIVQMAIDYKIEDLWTMKCLIIGQYLVYCANLVVMPFLEVNRVANIGFWLAWHTLLEILLMSASEKLRTDEWWDYFDFFNKMDIARLVASIFYMVFASLDQRYWY